jgi:hypothetical protein
VAVLVAVPVVPVAVLVAVPVAGRPAPAAVLAQEVWAAAAAGPGSVEAAVAAPVAAAAVPAAVVAGASPASAVRVPSGAGVEPGGARNSSR